MLLFHTMFLHNIFKNINTTGYQYYNQLKNCIHIHLILFFMLLTVKYFGKFTKHNEYCFISEFFASN